MPADPKSPRNFGFRQMPDPTGNSILFQMVFPGSYVLAAYSRTDDNHMGALQRIEVKDRPVEAGRDRAQARHRLEWNRRD